MSGPVASHGHGATGLGGFLDRERDGERPRPVDAVHDRAALAPDSGVEGFECDLVKIPAVGHRDLALARRVA